MDKAKLLEEAKEKMKKYGFVFIDAYQHETDCLTEIAYQLRRIADSLEEREPI